MFSRPLAPSMSSTTLPTLAMPRRSASCRRQGAKFMDGLEAGDIGRRFPVPNRVALLVNLVLSEHASQVRLVGLGAAIALLACSSFQLLAHHRHALAIAADIHDGRIARAWLSRSL